MLQVSHAWQDGHQRKVQMLRAFLCLDALLAQTAVAAVLLAAFLFPLGTGISVWVHWFPWWGPSMLPLALLALVLLWVALSRMGAMPRAWRPWAQSPRTIWLDKCCIDQSSPETIAAGTTAHLASFLQIATTWSPSRAQPTSRGFGGLRTPVPPSYALHPPRALFASGRTRTWPACGRCVYELATFCRMHKDKLDSRLLLLSPTWPSAFSPFKSVLLSEEERAPLTNFRLADVQCAMPRDRAIVLDAIRDEWGSEEAFETFVRNQLPDVLAASKQRYSRQMASVAGNAFEMAFGG